MSTRTKAFDIYVAIPYTHHSKVIKEYRFELCTCYTAKLTKLNPKDPIIAFSPITHSHPLDKYDTPTTWEFWKMVDEHILEHCEEIHVITAAGWKESVGVQAEIKKAKELGMKIKYISPSEIIDEGGWLV